MQTAKSSERRRLNAVVGLVVAGATLMAGLAALPVSKASAYESDDDFRDTISATDKPKLTVTKYLSTKPGQPATGSSHDGVEAAKGNTPASDVVFNVFEVKADEDHGKTIADVDPLDPGSYLKVAGQSFAGISNGVGVIDNWFEAAPDGSPTATPKEFPAGIHYYVMIENQAVSPSFQPGGRYAGQGYAPAQNSFFSLPYRTQDGSQKAGYLYHLHLYPKNVNNSDITKQVTTWTDANGQQGVLARPGDELTYQLNQKIYNEHPNNIGSSGGNSDGKLDVAELRQGVTDLRVSDRMSTALQYEGPATVVLVAGAANKSLVENVDYTRTYDETFPMSFDDSRGISTTKTLFSENPAGGTKYLTFDFFKNADSIKQFAADNDTVSELTLQISFKAKVTANGDSTGASQGSIQNTVMSSNSDIGNNVNPGGRIDTPAATASFGKVTKDGTALPGAVFRLVDPKDDNKFLASDGNTYPEGTKNVNFYTATSNAKGAVVFTALPIIENGVGRYGDWRLQEWSVPQGYDRPSVIFSKISFAPKESSDYDIKGKTAHQIVTHFGNKPLEATHKYLSFGRYVYNNGAQPVPPISVGGHQLDNYLANYKHGDPDAPVNLPLTGGRGIVLLLMIGLVVMGGALYARNRRNASRA